MKIINFIWDNWAIIACSIAFIVMIATYIKNFWLLPNDAKLEKVKEWLLYAVTEAEKEFGNGTGAIKLRKVYDLFIDKFSDISHLVSFEEFSEMVDEVLVEMRNLINSNDNINTYVYGDETEKEADVK